MKFKLVRESLRFYIEELLGRIFQTEERVPGKSMWVRRFKAFSGDNAVTPQDKGRRVVRLENTEYTKGFKCPKNLNFIQGAENKQWKNSAGENDMIRYIL